MELSRATGVGRWQCPWTQVPLAKVWRESSPNLGAAPQPRAAPHLPKFLHTSAGPWVPPGSWAVTQLPPEPLTQRTLPAQGLVPAPCSQWLAGPL